MSKRYTLEECHTALDVHPKTFKRWLKDDHITTETSKADKRIKFLTEEQVKRLAELHDKPWPPMTSQEAEVIPVAAYKLLIEQVTRAERQIEQIHAEQVTLQAGMVELRNQQETTASLVTAIQQEQARSAEAVQYTAQTLREHGDQIGSLKATLEEHQKQTSAELHSLTTDGVSTVARLDTLAAASQEQLGQFASQIEAIQEEMQRNHRATQEQLEQMQTVLEQKAHELNAAIQSAEQEDAHDVAQLTTTQGHLEQLSARVASAVSVAEEAKRTTEGDGSRILAVEQSLNNVGAQLQTQMVTTSTMTERMTQLETQVAQLQGETQKVTAEKPASTRRKTVTRKATEAEPTTEA
jgi:chromosome segregation ATPase